MKMFFISFTVFCMLGCTTKIKYVEKQSEELSRAVYATKDSLEYGRLDLAGRYSTDTTRLVAPPKQKIKIEAIIKVKDKDRTERVLILPQNYRNDKIISVDSPEYVELLKDSRIAEQLKGDVENWKIYSDELEKKLTEQYDINNEMIIKLNNLENEILKKDKKLIEKDLAILWRNITIVSLIGTMGVGVYFRIKGIL